MEANRLTEAPGGGGTGGLVVESPSGTHFRGLFSGGRVARGVCVCAHLMHVYTLQCVLLLYASKLIQAMVPYLDKIHSSDGPRWTKQTTLLHLQNEGVYIYT